MNETTATETPAKKVRANKIAAEKEALRAQLAALANKVPEKVNAGSIQTTNEWLKDVNAKLQPVARGGKKRLSRHALRDLLAKAQGWHK